MRFRSLLCFSLALGAICAAQESNFPAGPQYLMNYGSPLFFQSIATPSLSLSPPANPTAEAGGGVQLSLTPGPIQKPLDLLPIYYGAAAGENPAATESSSLIEISGAELPATLPPSIVNVGVQEVADAQSLRLLGYGVTVAEAASFWKTHKPHAVRVFTNQDVERLHGN